MTVDQLADKLIALRNETKRKLQEHEEKMRKALALAEELEGLGVGKLRFLPGENQTNP